jgi:hypothetical protein
MSQFLLLSLIALLLCPYTAFADDKPQSNFTSWFSSLFSSHGTASQLSPAAKLELQSKCAKQAREEFISYGYSTSTGNDTLVNHYNEMQNRCYMEITSMNDKGLNKFIQDAFERKIYGSYSQLYRTAGKGADERFETPIMECYVIMPNGEQKTCHSSDEFEALAKQYSE